MNTNTTAIPCHAPRMNLEQRSKPISSQVERIRDQSLQVVSHGFDRRFVHLTMYTRKRKYLLLTAGSVMA